VDERVDVGRRAGSLPPLPWLRRMFGLSPFEEQSLLVCLAPELDRKYAAAYAGRTGGNGTPTVGLLLELRCRSTTEAWRARAALEEGAPLLRWRLLERTPAAGASGLADPLRLDPGLLRVLLGVPLPDPRLRDVATLDLWPGP